MKEDLIELADIYRPQEASALLFQDDEIIVDAPALSRSVAHFSNVDWKWLKKMSDIYGKPSSTFHSHPCAAIPSGTDRHYMKMWAIAGWDCKWLILSDTNNLRAWKYSIENGVYEVKI